MALPYLFSSFPDDPDDRDERRLMRLRTSEPASDLPVAERLRVDRIRAGDERAYDALFVEFYSMLREFCVTFVRNVVVAEDVVQDVFLDVWVRHREWDPAGGIRPYLFRAVRNRALNSVRNARTAERLAPRGMEEWAAGPPPTDAGSPESALEEALAPIIDALPPARRRAAMLRWHFGMSYAEIAAIMETSVASVTKHIARAREDVRPVVERYLRE